MSTLYSIQRCYALLELTFPSTREEVKKSFRRLAHIYHPDKGGDMGKFKEINNAYQILMQQGYWDVIEKTKTTPSTGAQPEKENWPGWAKQIFIFDEETQMYCVIDSDENIIASWPKDPDAGIDGVGWRAMDDSEGFKDYTKHLKDTNGPHYLK